MHEVFAHTADIGLRVRAATLEDLFCEAAAGLFSLIVSNLEVVQPRQEIIIALPARDGETDYLLFDWLNELLFIFDSRRLVFAKFSVQLSPTDLQATAWGEPIDATRHQLDHEVKAITYHGLKVVPDAGVWLAEVIVDI
jgi:SHS2 domain-containing protein